MIREAPKNEAPRGIFVTATDTGAGKTFCSALLIRALRREGVRAAGFKPFCCGGRDDAERLAEASGHSGLDRVNPFWYRSPAAPLAAAMIEGRPPDLDLVRRAFTRLIEETPGAFIVVEGAGGWLVPITENYFMADLARDLALPVLLVVPNRLGCLNHALLTARAINASGALFAGWFLNEIEEERPGEESDPARATNGALLEQLLGRPPLARVSHGQDRIDLPNPAKFPFPAADSR